MNLKLTTLAALALCLTTPKAFAYCMDDDVRCQIRESEEKMRNERGEEAVRQEYLRTNDEAFASWNRH